MSTAGNLCPCCARRAADKRAQNDRLKAARAEAREKVTAAAVEDASLLHTGGASLERAARLAAAYHKAKRQPVYRRLRELMSYPSGRPARSTTEKAA